MFSSLQFKRGTIDQLELKSISEKNNFLLVDFDYTLFGCNSTELFISACKPSMVIAIIDFMIRRCVPWKLTGLTHWFRLRDYVCCIAIVIFCPWSLVVWTRVAPKLFRRYESREVSGILQRFDLHSTVIISFGMDFIIKRLLRGSVWEGARLLATPLAVTPSYFSRGKLPLALSVFGQDMIASSTFVSDSLDDGDLLQAARSGLLIEPQGETFRAAEHLYIPLRYTASAKYSRSYVFDQIIFVDLLISMISTAASLRSLWAEFLFVPLLTLSIMCIYEIGYYENDMVAAGNEKAPTLTAQVARFQSFPLQPAAWVWAAATGVLGISLAAYIGDLHRLGWFASVVTWAAVLCLLRVVFFYYNGPSLSVRLYLYPVLQTFKYLPIFLVLRPTGLGVILVVCQVATMWVTYATYRFGGNHKAVKRETFRTVLLLLGLCLAAAGGLLSDAGEWFAGSAMAVWSLARLSKAPLLEMLHRRNQNRRRSSTFGAE